MATAKKTETVEIRPLEIKETKIRLVGDTPLLVHAWSEKAKRQMLETQQGTNTGKKKQKRNPVDDFIQACYWLTPKPSYPDGADEETAMAAFDAAVQAGARFGFKAKAIKMAAQSAAYRLNWVKNQMGMRGALFIRSDSNGLVEIHSDVPVMSEEMVTIGQGKSDLRYRPQFNNWYMDLTILYNEDCGISWENMINAINAGGIMCGIGEWRPERDGDYGRFHVASV